jgi:hypothetical protein
MARHRSATTRKRTPRTSKRTSHITSGILQAVDRTSNLNDPSQFVGASLRRRARLLTTKSSIPQQTRNLIRYAVQIKDPDLAQLVRRVEAGEMRIDYLE